MILYYSLVNNLPILNCHIERFGYINIRILSYFLHFNFGDSLVQFITYGSKAWFSYVPRIVKIGDFPIPDFNDNYDPSDSPVHIYHKNPSRSEIVGDASKNRNASYSYDSYDSYDMELGSSGTDWDA